MKWIFTCEHGGNKIPHRYKHLFKGAAPIIESHRGYDPGALDLYLHLKNLADYSQAQENSRLLIELNRSLHHPNIFSEFTETLSSEEKKDLIQNFYLPYRDTVESNISDFILQGEKVIHISVHSFTPVLNEKIRKTAIGILYDPGREEEKVFARKCKEVFMKHLPELTIRSNYPYLGKADGFTTFLRKKFPNNYIGIELEVNQKFSLENEMDEDLKTGVFRSFAEMKDHLTI